MRRRGLRLATHPKNRTETNTALVQPAAPPPARSAEPGSYQGQGADSAIPEPGQP
jgi:hypothetical protein